MLRKFAEYGAGLIALYLVVANASGFGTAMTGVRDATTDTIKAFQGR